MTCLCLAFMGAVIVFQGNHGVFTVLSSIVFSIDAIIGAALFISKNIESNVNSKQVQHKENVFVTAFNILNSGKKD